MISTIAQQKLDELKWFEENQADTESQIEGVKSVLRKLQGAALIDGSRIYHAAWSGNLAPRKHIGHGRWTDNIPLEIVERK